MSRELKWEGKPWTAPGEPEEGGVYTLLNSSGCIALGTVFLFIENVIFMQYILIQVLLASFSPPYRLNYMSSLSRFRKQRGKWSKQISTIKKQKKKAQETYTQAETYTHKTHKNTKLETIIYKERLLRQNCPFTGNNHITLLPARMRLLTLTGIRMGLESW